MMGCSPYETRTQLMHRLKTGITPDVDAATQRRFDDGHRFEALARPLADEIVGEDLYPMTGTEGKLSASFDGLTVDDLTNWEHKSLNAVLIEWFGNFDRADIEKEANNAGAQLPLLYRVQMEHQTAVSGSTRSLFMASKWTDNNELVEEHHCWYMPGPKLRAAIIAGWEQFAIDYDAYVPVEAAPVAIGRAPESLPALHIVLKGEVSASNLDEFKQVALTAIRSVNRDLQTDQDFADSAKARKWCQDIEDRVAAAKGHALSQTATIDTLFRALDEVSAEAAAVRLALEKLEKARTQSLNEEIVIDGKLQFAIHLRALNAAMPAPYMPQIAVDFGVTIKGLRTVASKKNAVATELARLMILANEHATRIQGNLKTLDANPTMAFLFSDKAQIVLKAADDLQALVANRIAEHERKEAARLEAEREKIRAEEQAKAEAAVREVERVKVDEAAKLAREAAEARRKEQAEAATAAMEGIDAARQAGDLPAQIIDALEGVATHIIADLAVSRASEASKPANVVPITRAAPAPQAAPATPPTLKLGEIGTRLGFSLTGDFVKTLGFEPAARDKSALLFHEASFGHICAALVAHINSVQAQRAA